MKYMSIAEAVEMVAGYFKVGMREFDCETFKELCDLLWWDTADIKCEVETALCDTDGAVLVDEEDGKTVWSRWGEQMTYRAFIASVRQRLAIRWL